MILGSSITPPPPFTGALSSDLGSRSMFGGMLGSPGGSSQPKKPPVVGETGNSCHPLSSEAYILDWVIGRDSLLSENIADQEWSRYVHPPTTIDSLAEQSDSRMADDLRYAAAQASALMVLVAVRVFCTTANAKQLKTL